MGSVEQTRRLSRRMAESMMVDLDGVTDRELEQLDAYFAELHQQRLLSAYAAALPSQTTPEDGEHSEASVNELEEFVRHSLTRQLLRLAMLQYQTMVHRNDFGPLGERAVSTGFCRMMLHVPDDKPLRAIDMERMQQRLEAFEASVGLCSADEYEQAVNDARILLLGRWVPYYQLSDLDQTLQVLGVPFGVAVSSDRGQTAFLFGNVSRQKIDSYEVVVVESEWVRSPQRVISVAGIAVAPNRIIVRRTSLRVMFVAKWSQPKVFSFWSRTIADQLRDVAFERWRCGSQRIAMDSNAGRGFVEKMVDGVLAHETGHRIEDHDLPFVCTRIHSTYFGAKMNTLGVITELIADWAPRRGDVMGAMARFAQRARSGEPRSHVERDIWVYLNDNCFYGDSAVPEGYVDLTLAVHALVFRFISPGDRSVDFAAIDESILSTYQFLLRTKVRFIHAAISIVERGTYTVAGHRLSYEELGQRMLMLYRESGRYFTGLDHLRRSYDYWLNLLEYARLYSPETQATLTELQKTARREFSQAVLSLCAGPLDDRRSLRHHVFAQYKYLGVTGGEHE